MCLLSFLKWGSIGYPLRIVQWDFTRRDHPGKPGRVSGSGLVSSNIGGDNEDSEDTSGDNGAGGGIGASGVIDGGYVNQVDHDTGKLKLLCHIIY